MIIMNVDFFCSHGGKFVHPHMDDDHLLSIR